MNDCLEVLMVGVGPKRVGGMWTVAEQYLNSTEYNSNVKLTYVPTSTNGSIITRFVYMLIGYAKIAKILIKRPIDIVHIHMAEKGSAFRKGRVAEWAKNMNKKVIIHLHAGPFMAWYNSVSLKKQKRIKRIFECADIVLVLGEYWKDELKVIIPENKMIVLYNGVQCPTQNPYKVDARNIVYFGVMRKEKGTYDLIDAVEKIDELIPEDIKVVLCGNDLEGNIREIIKEKGLTNRFVLPGWVNGEQKERIYKEAMMDILPSYYEGLSMTILEAMARGIPVITTNISTMPELVEERNMIHPGDVDKLAKRIIEFVESEEERKTISEYEFSRVKKCFSSSEFIERTLSIYRSLL